ncbi:MAG: metallophosphoesterase [Candidatus Heimdallarchaeota archaeon]|nr:MAG: metallophosphoesterase [Candidatus Heimdallarchaeota archaeon]
MVKIGVISDTHDNQIAIKDAIRIFREGGVELVFHCGDFIAPFSVKALFKFPLRLVFGNNDGEKRIIRQLVDQQQQCKLEDVLLAEEIHGKRIAMTHGHHPNVLDLALESGVYDIVLSGHNHEKMSESLPNGTVHVNPGEAGGWLKGSPSVAIIDLETMVVDFKDIQLS